jgi:prepilin-type N-terminal cleavage/methylation domain-containing protein/prepilin-type processing-associated H-X9-DG protein
MFPRRIAALRFAPALRWPAARRGFSLVELLVVVAVVAMLLAILAPSLTAARRQARQVKCASHLRQLAVAFHMYAQDHDGRALPLAYFKQWPLVYWWGKDTPGGVDHTCGMTAPYLASELAADSVFDCPEQAWGSYAPQGEAKGVTSTYGYNGYYLTPAQTPGWERYIGHRPWQTLDSMPAPQRVFVFADTLLELPGAGGANTALLDPPWLLGRRGWSENPYPTTSFRHAGRTNAAHADGHVAARLPGDGRVTSQELRIGSVGAQNDPHYVPDWREW